MSAVPRLSVVVPVLDGEALLGRSLTALEASDLERGTWELVVVDDGSSDESGAVAARHADRIVRVEGGPRGPAFGRNRGVEVARGEVIAFVDMDVTVHTDALRRMLAALDSDPTVAAVFGSYDDGPEAAGFLSQYRNLLHRYVHLAGSGEADTFWAGCGAVRRDAFLEAGGFDAAAFRRPQIEDIDLGYRLRDRGWRILLLPDVQGTHLKRWTLGAMIRADVIDRGIPWMRLLLRRRTGAGRAAASRAGTLNIRWQEKAKTALVAAALLLMAAGFTAARRALLVAGLATLGLVLLANVPLYAWFARQRGVAFALGVVPLSVLYYVLNAGSTASALFLHWRDRLSGRLGAETMS